MATSRLPKSQWLNVEVGGTYGQLEVLWIGLWKDPKCECPNYYALCKCSCGVEKYIQKGSIRRGETRSCGCFHKKLLSQRELTHGEGRASTRTKEYRAWCNILTRCSNPRIGCYKHYGGRGIRVCERWAMSYENFLADMGRAPSPKHSIDRIDHDGNYEPGNCKWSTQKEQVRNTRSNVNLTYSGLTLTLAEWAEKVGMRYMTLYSRINAYGWPIERALTKPLRRKHESVGASVGS